MDWIGEVEERLNRATSGFACGHGAVTRADIEALLNVARAAEALADAQWRDGLKGTSGYWIPLRAALDSKP